MTASHKSAEKVRALFLALFLTSVASLRSAALRVTCVRVAVSSASQIVVVFVNAIFNRARGLTSTC